MATLAHALQLVGWFIAPLVILLIKRDSRFVSFHALQALLLQVVYMICWGLIMAVFFASFFFLVPWEQSQQGKRQDVHARNGAATEEGAAGKEASPSDQGKKDAGKEEAPATDGKAADATAPTTTRKTEAPPAFLFLLFPVFWLFSMGAWVVMLSVVIVYAIKAGRGEWAAYPILGGWARKLLGMPQSQ